MPHVDVVVRIPGALYIVGQGANVDCRTVPWWYEILYGRYNEPFRFRNIGVEKYKRNNILIIINILFS
jgi:hypothetical protein